MNTPKAKEELIFQDNFIDKIKQGIKTKTIRNSPVTIGTKKLSDDLSIDVYKVERVQIKEQSFENEDYYFIVKQDDTYQTSETAYRKLGFESKQELINYYKAYLKRDDAYLIHFRLI